MCYVTLNLMTSDYQSSGHLTAVESKSNRSCNHHFSLLYGNKRKLERCIDDARQLFKTAKRPQAAGDATVRKRFSAITSFFRRRSKRIAFLESVNFSTCRRLYANFQFS